jgi:UDP-glucose 4-epimerase
MVLADLAGRRVLVTGATGFIGVALSRRLLDLGAQVYGVTRTARNSDDQPLVHWCVVDLADADATLRVLYDVRPDVVFHLASRVSGDRSLTAVGPTVRDNLLTTVNLLTAACESGRPRVVVAGSMEECDADDACVPGSPYAAAKTAAAVYGRMFHALYGLPVVHLRVFMVYGPGRQDTSKLVPYVIRSLQRGESPMLSSGNREVDWVYIDDVVDAFVAAADLGAAQGATVDVGSGELVTIRALVEQLVPLVGGGAAPQFGARADRPFERHRVADLGAAHELLDWSPATPLPTGLARTVSWFRDHQQHSDQRRNRA